MPAPHNRLKLAAPDASHTRAQERSELVVTDEMNGQRFYSGTRADLKPGDRFYHGTRADLTPGDLIKPGHPANFGKLDRVTTYVYFSLAERR